jgi:hypothetical protein
MVVPVRKHGILLESLERPSGEIMSQCFKSIKEEDVVSLYPTFYIFIIYVGPQLFGSHSLHKIKHQIYHD